MENRSLLRPDPRILFSLGSWSVTIWLIFELFNLRLHNWHYVNLVSNTAIRWAGYTLAYATVLPGIFITFTLLKNLGVFTGIRLKRRLIADDHLTLIQLSGLLLLLLPLILPEYFFPLVWGGFVLLLDPLNYKRGIPSLLADIQKGTLCKTVRLLAAGLICGFLWEFWNFWAASKWIYTVPFVGNIKLFEMPVLGFLGFPPFALECYAMYNFLAGSRLAVPWEQWPVSNESRWARVVLTAVLQIPFWFACYWLIDKYSVLSFK